MVSRKQIGQGLFALGIAIAVSAAAKLPEPPPAAEPPGGKSAAEIVPLAPAADAAAKDERPWSERFPDTLPVFCGAAAAALVGLVLWRSGVRAVAKEPGPAKAAADPTDPLVILQGLLQPLDKLQAELDDLDAPSLLRALDDLDERYVMPFATARQRVTDRLGMSAGAEVLLTAAVGERMLHRGWSAAADGHLPEARSSVREAVQAFHEAARLADRKP